MPFDWQVVNKQASWFFFYHMWSSILKQGMIKIYKTDLMFYSVWPQMSEWLHKVCSKLFTEVKTESFSYRSL